MGLESLLVAKFVYSSDSIKCLLLITVNKTYASFFVFVHQQRAQLPRRKPAVMPGAGHACL
jgi:hypothetical protein